MENVSIQFLAKRWLALLSLTDDEGLEKRQVEEGAACWGAVFLWLVGFLWLTSKYVMAKPSLCFLWWLCLVWGFPAAVWPLPNTSTLSLTDLRFPASQGKLANIRHETRCVSTLMDVRTSRQHKGSPWSTLGLLLILRENSGLQIWNTGAVSELCKHRS